MSASREGVAELFERSFGRPPLVIVSAPGRVNLIGEHTDYNGGEVLPIAIARRTWVALDSNAGGSHRAITQREPGIHPFSHAEPQRSGGWWDYVAGVARVLENRGVQIRSFDLAVTSDVPAGAGLSSSAALEVAAATGLVSLAGEELSIREIALIGNQAENEYVGVQSGVMDQFASGLGRAGHALHLSCDTIETAYVPFGDAVLIFDTRIPRSLLGSAFNTRRQECQAALQILRQNVPDLSDLAAATPEQVEAADLPAPLRDRALHVTRETRRVGEVVDALRRGEDLPGDVLLASHASLRDLYDCSSPELNWFVDRVVAFDGVRGARLTGAGWGGCAIAVGDEAALAEAGDALARDYAVEFGREPGVWITRAAPGVEISTSPD